MKNLRLGLIVPSSNTTMETEFRRVLPSEIGLYTGRMRLKKVTVEALVDMEKSVVEEALKLADALVDVIGYGCTSGSLVKGLHHDKEIVSKIERATGIRTITTAGAVIEALKAVGSREVAVATPYINEINTLEKEFLEGNGFEVLDIRGLGIVENIKIGLTENKIVIDLVRSLDHKNASAIFISCTNLPTMTIIEGLEEELQKPVISSNTATLWSMLRRGGFYMEIQGIGKLFSQIFSA